MANVELINQILNAYRASGVSEDRLAEMQSELQELNDAELQQKLTEALNQRGNWGNIGDSFTLNTSPLFEQPAKPQLPVLPKLSVEATIPELTEEQAQEIAMRNLWAINGHLAAAQGELDPEKLEGMQMLITAEARELYYLDKARSPEGLTFKEYLEDMKNDLRVMLLRKYPNLGKDNSALEQRLDAMSPEDIKNVQQALIKHEFGILDDDSVREILSGATEITENYTVVQYEKEYKGTRKRIKPPYQYSQNPEELIKFDELYKTFRGTDFNPATIRQYLIDGTVTFYENPFENGFPSLEDLEKHTGYVNNFSASYISSFGQPYRAEYLSVLQNSDFDSSAAYGVHPVRLDKTLHPSESGMEFVIPTEDLTQGTVERELNEKELKRFSANMLYNILNTTYNMFKGYYDGAWDQLKSGSVGTAAVQGFLAFGELLSGQDLTVRSQMDKVGDLLAKATQLKNMDDNAFEQHFDEMFAEISGTSFDIMAMQNFAQLTMKGIKTDTKQYDEAVTRAFGSNRTGNAETQFSVLNPINGVVDIVAFLAGSEVLGETKLLSLLGKKSIQLTSKAATKLGFDLTSKGVQTGARLIAGSPVSAANMMTYTAITEIGGTSLYYGAERMGVIKPEHGEYMSVMNPDFVGKHSSFFEGDNDFLRITVDLIKQGAMGSVAPFIGAVANKTGRTLATTFSKGNPTAIQKSFSAFTKAEAKTVNAQTLMSDYLSALDTPALTKMQKVIETSSGFLTEVAGFTGYSTLEYIAEGLITGELDLDSLDLGEEFKGQLEGLATLKGVARFIQMKKSGSVARGVQDKAMADMTEHLKNYDIKEIGGKYQVMNKNEGKWQTFDKPEEVINHLFEQMFFESAAARYTGEFASAGAEPDPYLENPDLSSDSEFYVGSGGSGAKKVTRSRKSSAKKGVASDSVPVDNAVLSQELTKPVISRLKSFGMEKVFTPEELLTDSRDVARQVGVDKEGNPIYELTEKGQELAWRAARQIRESALANEPNIIEFMRQLGLASDKSAFTDKEGNMIDIAHRAKSDQSIHDKLQNIMLRAVKKDKDLSLAQAISEVNDGVGTRTAILMENYADKPDVKAAIEKGDMKNAIMLAVEHESSAVYEALEKYIDSVADGTNKVEIIRIANYIGEDGIPYFTERQLNRLKAYADSKGVSIPFIERVNTLAERQAAAKTEDDRYNPDASTQIRGSGYTALQMNFVDKATGFVYEWQFRGQLVNEFAEGEHVPYDLRTGKDIIGDNEALKGLYEPMKKILDKETMSDTDYKEYENYLTAYYEYLRMAELGFNDGKNPPKLPAKFDARLRAENLMLLHEYSDKVKKGPDNADKITKEYESKLIQNTAENTTTESYTKKAEEKENDRVIDEYEASRRVGENNGLHNDGQNASLIIDACRDNGTGEIRENLIKEAEKMQLMGIDDNEIAQRIIKMKNGETKSAGNTAGTSLSENSSVMNERRFNDIVMLTVGLKLVNRTNKEWLRDVINNVKPEDREEFTKWAENCIKAREHYTYDYNDTYLKDFLNAFFKEPVLRTIAKKRPDIADKYLIRHSGLHEMLRDIPEDKLIQLIEIKITDEDGEPDIWDSDDSYSIGWVADKAIELSKIIVRDKNGKEVPLFTNKEDFKNIANISITVEEIKNLIQKIQNIAPDYDISAMNIDLLTRLIDEPEPYIKNVLKLSELKTPDEKSPLLSDREILDTAKYEDCDSVIEFMQITRTTANGSTEKFSPEQIRKMQEANVDIAKIKELAAETYKDNKGNVKPRFDIEDLYNLSVVDRFAIDKLKDIKWIDGTPMLNGLDISTLSQCRSINNAIKMLMVRIERSNGPERIAADDVVEFVDNGYSAKDVQRLFDIKWNDDGTSILNPRKAKRILDSGADLNTVEKLYSLRGTNGSGGEQCFGVDHVLDLAQKDFKDVYELYSMKYTDKNGQTQKRFTLSEIHDLADYNTDDVVKLAEQKWNDDGTPLLNASQIKELIGFGDIDKVVRLLKIRTSENGETRFSLGQVKALFDKNIYDVEKLADHKFRYNDDQYLKLDTGEIVKLSSYDAGTAIKTYQRVLNNRSKYHKNANLVNITSQILEAEKTTGEKSAPQHQAEMYKYYSELTDKNGNRIFDGRNGRMDEREVLNYMANLPEGSKEATAVRMLTSLVQDGQVGAHVLKYLPKEGHINPLIAEDVRLFYDAYLNNIPLNDVMVPTIKSQNKTSGMKTGDVFEVAGEKNIYIKGESGKAVQLQMDKATYCKLFPPIERYATTQNAIGNCWQITGFNGIMRDPIERLSVLEAIRQEGDDIVIKFPNGRLGDIRFKNGEMPKGADPKFYSEGALGINMLEYAQGLELQKEIIDERYSNLYKDIQNADTEERRNELVEKLTQITQTLYKTKNIWGYTFYRNSEAHGFDYASTSFRVGGRSNTTWDLLGYKNAKDYAFNKYNCRPFLNNPKSFEKHLIGWASAGVGENDILDKKGIVSGHAYWLKPNLDDSGNIKNYDVLNPWGILETTLSLDEVMRYGQAMYVAERKQR